MYGENMRWYDSIHNKWDVCTEFFPEDNFDLFEPTALPSSTSMTLAPFASMRLASPTLPLYPPQSPQPPPHELALDHSAEYVFDSFIDTLYYQYSLLCSLESIMTLNPTWDFASVCQYVLDNQSPLLAIDEVQPTSVTTFFISLRMVLDSQLYQTFMIRSQIHFPIMQGIFPLFPCFSIMKGTSSYLLMSHQETGAWPFVTQSVCCKYSAGLACGSVVACYVTPLLWSSTEYIFHLTSRCTPTSCLTTFQSACPTWLVNH